MSSYLRDLNDRQSALFEWHAERYRAAYERIVEMIRGRLDARSEVKPVEGHGARPVLGSTPGGSTEET